MASQVAHVGLAGVGVIAATLIATLTFTKWLGRVMGVDAKLAELIGAGTSICGASAVIATNTVTRGSDEARLKPACSGRRFCISSCGGFRRNRPVDKYNVRLHLQRVVAPDRARHSQQRIGRAGDLRNASIARGPSITAATSGPEVMNSTSAS